MDELKVISFNVHSCVGSDEHYSIDRVAQALRQAEHSSTAVSAIVPTVVCLQEVEANATYQQTRVWSSKHSSHQPMEIAQHLELPHVRFAPAITSIASSRFRESHHVREASCGEFGIAILSKYPIVKTKHYLYRQYKRKTLRNALACLVELCPNDTFDGAGGAQVWIVNTHLGCHWGGEQFQQATELVQFIDALEITEKVVGVVLCGDFNSLPFFRSIKTIKTSGGMTDTFAQAGIGSGRTFPAVDKIMGAPLCFCVPSMRLDYIFVKGRNSCLKLKYAIVARGDRRNHGDTDHDVHIASDHLPLCAVFVVRFST